jgi:hypothetical protein
MKNLIILSFMTCFLFSCNKSEKFDSEKYPQKWQLIKISTQFAEKTGTDMEWQEYYLLNSNGSFTKHRERNGTITDVSGTFIFKNLTDGKFIQFTYPSDNSIIANCDNTFIEYLHLRSENKLTGNWHACDGAGLEYERTE